MKLSVVLALLTGFLGTLIIALGCTTLGCTTPGAGSGRSGAPSSVAGPHPSGERAAEPGSAEQEPAPARLETAILAGGCFWGMEEILRKIPGVVDTEVGYTGGTSENPSYEDVHDGKTGHAEAVRVRFDPSKLSYADLLEKWFFRMHDPTTKDRQGNDVGSSYRSAIFYTSPEQQRIAEEVKKRVDASGFWHDPVVTEITEAGRFTPAEGDHQDYLQKNPGGYTCHFIRHGTDL